MDERTYLYIDNDETVDHCTEITGGWTGSVKEGDSVDGIL